MKYNILLMRNHLLVIVLFNEDSAILPDGTRARCVVPASKPRSNACSLASGSPFRYQPSAPAAVAAADTCQAWLIRTVRTDG